MTRNPHRINGWHIQDVLFEPNAVVLVTPKRRVSIPVSQCLQGWQAWAKSELNKDIPLEDCTCLGLLSAPNGNVQLQFLDGQGTTVHFPGSWFRWGHGPARTDLLLQPLYQQGFTTYNVE